MEAGGKAGVLVQAAEGTDEVNDLVFFLGGFSERDVTEVIKGLLNLVGIVRVNLIIVDVVKEAQDG